VDWEAKLAWADAERERRSAAEPRPGERDDLRLAGIAGASWAAGLAALMLGREDEARRRLVVAAESTRRAGARPPPAAGAGRSPRCAVG
jgi:hypothetical protein